MSTDDQPDLDPQLAEAVRRAYVQPLDEATVTRHVSAIFSAAAAAEGEFVRPPARSHRRAWRAAAAGVAATLMLPVGLAVAGVSLPKVVSRPYDSIGVSLPHQANDDAQPATPGAIPPTPTTPRTSTSPAPRAGSQPATRPEDRPKAARKDGAAGSQAAPQAKANGAESTPASPRTGSKAEAPPGRQTGKRAKPARPTPPVVKPKKARPSPQPRATGSVPGQSSSRTRTTVPQLRKNGVLPGGRVKP